MSQPAWQLATLDTYFDIQCRKKDLKKHRRRVKRMKSEVKNKPPKRLPHLSSSSSKQTFSDFEYKRIDMENQKLLSRLHDLSNEKSRYKYHPRLGSKNVGDMLRKNEKSRIEKDNEILARRLRSVKPVYQKKEWDEKHKNHLKVMNERMRRHAVRIHGPKMAKKIEERIYCGKHRSYSDLGSEMSFETISDAELTSSRTQSTFTNESCYTNSSRSSSYKPPTGRSGSKRPSARKQQSSTANIEPLTTQNQSSRNKQIEKTQKLQSEIQEFCFSQEHLHKAVNPCIPEIAMRPTPVATESKKPDPDEISDWEDDAEWQEQELTTSKPGRTKHRVIQLNGVKL